MEKSCKLQKAGTGDAFQWSVLALAHAKLAAQEGLPEKEREHHKSQARRWYEQADKQIDSWWRVRPSHETGQAIWDFRAEARELLAANVVLAIVAFGTISVLLSSELADGSPLARAVCGYIAIFWGIRLALQGVFHVKPHLTVWWLKLGYLSLTVVFLAFTVIYAITALWPN